MPGESQLPPTSAPDPTVATNDAVDRGDAAERDYVNGQLDVLRERLIAIDRATALLNDTVTRTPTDIQKEVTHLREWMLVELRAVGTQFTERDTRSERESRDNKIAVDAAFAAQKEIAAKQDEGNAKALEKSEKATEKIIDVLSEKIDDLKERLVSTEARVVAIESGKVATREVRADSSAGSDRLVNLLGLLVAVIVVALAIYAALHR